MNSIETNIFPILNLKELSAAYRAYRIRGLHSDHPEYFQNRQAIARQLSYSLRTPALVLDIANHPTLIVRNDAASPASPMQLVRGSVYFDDLNEIRDVDFLSDDPEQRQIAIRFLQFMLQAPLSANRLLWQPGAGKPFYEKQGESDGGGISRYTGFAARVTSMPNGGLGLCVDVASKFASSHPLSNDLTRHQFRPYKGRSVIYRYGHKWYEVRLNAISDLSLREYHIPQANLSLLDFILQEVEKPAPPEIVLLGPTSSVVLYKTNTGDLRGAPAVLCYPVLDSLQVPTFAGKRKLLAPHERRRMSQAFVTRYLQRLRFGGVQLQIASMPLSTEQKLFSVPDLQFGNNYILSTTSKPSTQHVSLDSLGRARAALLRDTKAGFYTTGSFGQQMFVMPQSIADTSGNQFLADLRAAVDELYPSGGGYKPELVVYNDRVGRNFIEQGKAILQAIESDAVRSAYAVVMLHDTRPSRLRQHDQLAALVSRKLAGMDIVASVIHTEVVSEAYRAEVTSSGSRYFVRQDKKARLSGYLRNVALNKILLTNERWPFVLASPLYADLTIGIDVKHNTAGLTLVSNRGQLIRTKLSTSSQKEKLLSQQVRKLLFEIVKAESEATFSSFSSIVIHRDGILFDSEHRGFLDAVDELRNNGTLASDSKHAFLEISKSAASPLRLYDVTANNGRDWVENPQVGTHYLLDEANAFLCATGRAFFHQGTVKPLHIRYIDGNFPFAQCVSDVYSLTCLAWAKPDDCMRDPITVKLTDRRLGEDASPFDEDAFEFEVMGAE